MQKADDKKWDGIISSLRQVFKNPLYVVLATIVGVFLLLLAIYLPNLGFISDIAESNILTITQKTNIILSLLGGLKTNFSFLSRITTIIISILFGVNTALAVYYFRTRTVLQKEAGISLGGMLMGLIGVGCASCGSIILASILGLSVSLSIVGLLPFKGQEFGLIGMGLLIFAITITARKIATPIECKIDL